MIIFFCWRSWTEHLFTACALVMYSLTCVDKYLFNNNNNNTTVTQQWHYSDTTVTQQWHNSDTTVTLQWHNSDTTVTQQWHNSDTTVTQQWQSASMKLLKYSTTSKTREEHLRASDTWHRRHADRLPRRSSAPSAPSPPPTVCTTQLHVTPPTRGPSASAVVCDRIFDRKIALVNVALMRLGDGKRYAGEWTNCLRPSELHS